MGTSKIIMLSGVYLVLGMYTLSFSEADKANSTQAATVASSIQAEQLARTGVSLAMTKMGTNSAMFSYSDQSSSVMNGTVVYSASRPAGFPASQSQITSTGTFNGKTLTITAVCSYDRGRWRIVRLFVPPTA